MGKVQSDKVLSLEERRIIKYVEDSNLRDKDNSPSKSDPRMYIMNILFYRFHWTDDEVAKLIHRTRTAVTTGRKKAAMREKMEDRIFYANTDSLRFLFPSLKVGLTKSSNHKISFICKITRLRERRVERFKEEHGLIDHSDAISLLIDKYL